MTEQDLLDRGYTEFDTGGEEDCIKHFQKKFTDNKGIKYFITCYEYKQIYHPTTGVPLLDNPFEFVVYFTSKETGNPLKCRLYSGWTIDEVEEFVEKQFKLDIYSYYEEFNCN